MMDPWAGDDGVRRLLARRGGSAGRLPFGRARRRLSPLGGELDAPSLDPLLAPGPSAWAQATERARELLARGDHVLPLAEADAHLPFTVADYVDFYSSREHATNIGRLFRTEDEPLLPNWLHLPVGYHGRAGTVVPSGTPIVRPRGQTSAPGSDAPSSARAGGSTSSSSSASSSAAERSGRAGAVAEALDHVFGLVLVNDWSARDIQAWEYRPLGPFPQGVRDLDQRVGRAARGAQPFRVPQPPQEPAPLPYLRVESVGVRPGARDGAERRRGLPYERAATSTGRSSSRWPT